MGSTATLVGAIALATALVSLFCGYLWGRSNVRSQVEDALDKARVSADAREFALRQELDEKMLELTELRTRTEELPRLRQQLERLNSEQGQRPASGEPKAGELSASMRLTQTFPEQRPQPPAVVESTDKTIEKFLKSMEEKLKEPEEELRVAVQESTTSVAEPAQAAPPFRSVTPALPPAAPAQPVAPAQPATPPPTLKSASPAKDEWQEFAASLAELRSRQK